METYLLDTNIVIRFLRQDHPTMGPAAKALFQAANRGEARLLLEESIVAEAVYVLQSVYKQSRTDVADALQAIVRRAPAIQTERPTVLHDALDRYRRQNQLDISDALLAASAADKQVAIASFNAWGQDANVVVYEPLTPGVKG